MITLTHGMVLAAGLGLRMRPLTETTAKPLLTLNGRSLLDHALDRLDAAGVRQAVVNAHWQAEKVAAAVAARAAPRLTLQREELLLETGGGVVKALPLIRQGVDAICRALRTERVLTGESADSLAEAFGVALREIGEELGISDE